ncbi:MAG: hypothetical protein ACRD2J_05245 [Thermoanaerobaculia bacterium]
MTRLMLEGDRRTLAAVAATAGLLARLGTRAAFVGDVARAAWLGELLEAGGAVDVVVAMGVDSARSIAMVAADEGFRVDDEEARRAEELDLLPMWWEGEEEPVRVHVLFASNALYGRMVRDAVEAEAPSGPVRIVSAEDLALLVLVAERPGWEVEVGRIRLRAGDAFDRDRLNRKLVSIGLGRRTLV